jgi:hypothetical protein
MYCKKTCIFTNMGAAHNYRAFLCTKCDYRFNPLKWTLYERSHYDIRVWFYVLWHRNSEVNVNRIMGLSKKLNRKDGGGVANKPAVRRMRDKIKELTQWQITEYLKVLVQLFAADYYEDFCLIDYNNEFVPKLDLNKILVPAKAFIKERLKMSTVDPNSIVDAYAIEYIRDGIWDILEEELEPFLRDLIQILVADKMVTELEYKILSSRIDYIMRLVENRINPFPDLLTREIEPGCFVIDETEDKEPVQSSEVSVLGDE